MFRRKKKSKNSFLCLHSSNRGSDIVRPNNSSLVVNESDTEADVLPKELNSIFSEDEDENLGDTDRKSSLIKSVGEKAQSTPLSETFSQNRVFKEIEEPCSVALNSRICPSVNNKYTSFKDRNSYFEKILKTGGAISLPGNSSFLMSEDQAVFSVKVNNNLKQNPIIMNKFFDSIKEFIKDKKNLQKMLAYTLTAEDCEVARGPVQEPLMRMLLNVDCLQADLTELLLETVADLVVNNKMGSGNIQLISSILRQMRFLSGGKNVKIASKLFEIIHIASVNVQREIIFMFPEIISEEEIENTCTQLIDLLKFDESLTSVIVDALANLPLNQALRSKVCSKILQRLDKCPLEFLPSLVQFVLNKCHTEEFHNVVNGLRNGLPFTLEHHQMKNVVGGGEKKISEEDFYIKLTFENLKFSAMASREMTEAWIKIIHSLNSSTDFRCMDLIMLIIFYSSLIGRKTQLLQLIRSKIKSAVLTQVQVQNLFKILVVILEEYVASILEMASAFLKSFDPKISNFGALLYKECFIHFHFFMRQTVISEILIHVGTGPPAIIRNALSILKELCENETEALSKHTAPVMGLLVKIQDLELIHVRVLIDIIAKLVFFESSGRGTVAQDELLIYIRKQLISSKPEQYKKGVSAAVIFCKHYGKESHYHDHNWSYINSLLELAMDLNGVSETKRGFFNDEFSTMIAESQLSKSFLTVWSEKTYSFVMERLFVKCIDVKYKNFPASVQYGLHGEDVQKLIFPVSEFVFSSSDSTLCVILSYFSGVPIPVIPSTLRLLWCLEKNVNRILPTFLASVVMPEETLYDNFSNLDNSLKKKILNCLFLCGNYLIESINALCARGIFDKAMLRVKQLTSIRKLLSRCIVQFSEFVPPVCQFHASAQSAFLKMKTSEKKLKRGRKRKVEIATETFNSSFESPYSPGTTAVCTKEDIFLAETSGQEADLQQYLIFFRELDFVSFELLDINSESKPDPESLGVTNEDNCAIKPELETSGFLFLLEDLLYKAELIIKSSEVTSYFKSKSVILPMQKMSPEDFILASIKFMPRLLDKIEVFSKYCENLLESNGWMCDSRGLYVQGACEIKFAMATGFKFIAEIISWRGFKNSNDKLLRDFLITLTKRGNSSKVNLNVNTLAALAIDAASYLATFKKTILVLSGALSIVKFFQACLQLSFSGSCNTLAELCREFLSRNWFTVTGASEKGAAYNQHIDFLLKVYFSSVENKLETIRVTVRTVFDEIGGLTGIDSSLKTFKTIKKSNFSLLYRTICEALTAASSSEFSKTDDDNEKQLDFWNKIVQTLLILVEIAKIHSSRVILASLLKRSQFIIQLFLSKGIPVVESALRVKSVEVLTLLKSFQIVTRFLHSVCCHSRITNDSVVASHVPVIRSLCERLTLEVKGMLILNNIPMDCITIAILKNRDIKGNDILSQETLDEESDDDSEFLPDDTPDTEVNLYQITNRETEESSEAY